MQRKAHYSATMQHSVIVRPQHGSSTLTHPPRMESVAVADFCAALYCAYVERHQVDLKEKTVWLLARLTSDGTVSRYDVRFEGVTRLSWSTPRPDPDENMELSVVSVDRLAMEGEVQWRVWFNPWYSDELQIECERVKINGAVLDGVGSYLQDGLPSRPAAVPPFAPPAA